HVTLADEICYPHAFLNLDKLNFSQRERLLQLTAMPRPVALFWLRPATGNCDDKAAAPSADVVAHMHDDVQTGTFGPGRVAGDVIDVAFHMTKPFQLAYSTNTPFRSATPMVAWVPVLNSKKSFSMPSLKITPCSGICDSSCKGVSSVTRPNTSDAP